MKPELTLVIPMYRVENYIERCLDSIYANPEAITSTEVILIDDGSPDRSAEVAQNWIDNNKIGNARIVHQENRGLGGARNTGLREAKSQWIWFIDSDDEITPDSLSYILPRLNSSLDFITFDYIHLPQNIVGYGYNKTHTFIPPEKIASLVTLNSPCFNIFRTGFLRDNDLWFKEKFLHEDNEFAIRVNFMAKLIAFYPIAIYKYYTTNGGSITNSISKKKIDNLLEHFEVFQTLLNEHPSRLQRKAMQRINTVALVWLLHCLKTDNEEVRLYAQKQIAKQRSRLRRAVSMMPLRFQLSVLVHTSPIYFKIRNYNIWKSKI